MKRRLRHALIWIVIVAAVAVMASRLLQTKIGGDGGAGLPEGARARLSVVLKKDQWTAFRIPSTAHRLKLLSRANFAADAQGLVDQEFPYKVEYQLQLLNGTTVAEGAFDLAAKVIPMVDADGNPQQAAFFHTSDLTPAAARASTLELPWGEVLILNLRAGALGEPIADVAVRAFTRQRISERKLAYKWNRLSSASRARISRPRVHALVDLTPEEQRSILQNRWIPFSAQGVAGSDFQERTLYLRDDLFPAKRELAEALGIGEIRCGENRRAIIGIPQPGGKVRLEFRRTDLCTPEGAAPPAAQIRFFGGTIQERSSHEHYIDGNLSGFSETFNAGMLEIESPVGVAVRPYWTAEGEGEQLLESDPAVVRAWRAGEKEAVTFPLGGDRAKNEFFRVSVRIAVDTEATLQFEFLNSAGSIVRAGEREIICATSFYDVLFTSEGESAVNDPLELVLEVPAGVAAIRFRADADVLLNGYTRPATLPHRTRVPEDYVRALSDSERLPVWFGLRPEGADDLVRSHRSFLIQSQTRPPEDDADILAGKYLWEDFQPGVGALGQYLLSDRDPDSPSRAAALPSLFMPLAVGVEHALVLANPAGLDLPSRRLAFVRSGREPAPFQIFIDGAAFFERNLVTGRGELLLPPILPGSRTIRIESPAAGLQCFLNYVPPDKTTKLKRLAQRISSGKSLVFQCEKATGEDELLTGMLFAPHGSEQEAEIHLAIRPGESGGFLPQADSFTPRERIYFVTPEADTRTPVLGGKIPAVDGGRRFFIPLGRDLRPGAYEVTITMRKGSDGYMTLSKVMGGDYSDARFFREVSR